MNKRINELAEQAGFTEGRYESDDGPWIESEFNKEKFAELIVKDYAKKTIQGLMGDPAFVQAMDEYYENKWSHRFD
jgi:hypothetical protein